MSGGNALEKLNRRSVAEIDQAHGTRCELVLDTAISLEPQISSTIVKVESMGACIAYHESHEFGGSVVKLSNTIGDFEQDLSDILQSRFVRLYQLFDRLDRPVLTADAIEFCFAHELGHSKLYLNHQHEKPGKNVEFLNELEAGRNKLPLKISSGKAREFWQFNIGGYRDRLKRAGYTEESFTEALIVNSFIYSQTRNEMLSDDFGLWVIATMHKTKS